MFLKKIVPLILAVSMIFIGLCGCSKSGQEASTDPQETEASTVVANARATILYYRDSNGYIIPVERYIPWEEAIGKAALKLLVSGQEEDLKLAANGLYATIPAGTEISLDINNAGLATCNLQLERDCASAEEETAMISSVVNTLMEFPAVETVAIQINGQKVDSLSNGTPVQSTYTTQVLNVEPAGSPNSDDGKLELCFTNQAGSMLVPVMRVEEDSITPLEACQQLLEPSPESGLVSVMPTATQILSVTVNKEGVATIDLSGEFASMSDMPKMERLAIKALTVTLMQFPNVTDVVITVDGKPYEPSTSTLAGTSEALNTLD